MLNQRAQVARRPRHPHRLQRARARADPARGDELVQGAQRDLRRAARPAGRDDLLARRLRQGVQRLACRHLFRELADRHAGQHGARAAVRRDGGLGADRIQVPRLDRARALPLDRHHGADPARLGRDPDHDAQGRPQRHADRADPRLYRAGPADVDLHPERIRPADPQGPARRGALRRRAGDAHLLRGDRAAAAARDRDGRRVHHRADLERPVVSADPDLVRTRPTRSRSACSSSSASTSPTGTRCSRRCRWRSCRWSRSTSSSRGN